MTETERIAQARLSFSQCNFDIPDQGDLFFQAFGAGNTIGITSQPYERFASYESILLAIQQDDPVKFSRMHKGQAYYIMAWICFDMKEYVKANFYIDCAISEDIRKTISRRKGRIESSFTDQGSRETADEWLKNPSGQFMLLDTTMAFVGSGIINGIIESLNRYVMEFNSECGNSISISSWVEEFIKNHMYTQKARSIITAFYSFLLEEKEIKKLIRIRGSAGGSIEPILTYLFRGALVFESILKLYYPKDTIGAIFYDTTFTTKYGNGFNTSSDSLSNILLQCSDWTIATVFSTTARIRNTTGHNLAWDDVFNDPGSIQKMIKSIVYSILYVYIYEEIRSAP